MFSRKPHSVEYSFFSSDPKATLSSLGKETLLDTLYQMLLCRQLEMRGEAAYQQGKVGGFYHAYIGQEAIQTGAVQALGVNNWYTTTYRCHALALLLGATPNEIMAELYGKATGNAEGRGGSMHLFTDRLLGGLAIVGGHIPIATGSAFTLKYKGIKDELAICFLGDGAVPQGAFHESLNLASLWDLPIIYVIENNVWGMGTHYQRANCVDRLAQEIAPSYRMDSYTFDGSDFLQSYALFRHLKKEVLEKQRPILVEGITQRFKGHSISDPGQYREKEKLKEIVEHRDPITHLKETLLHAGLATEEEVKELEKRAKNAILDAVDFAEKSPWPDPIHLEEGVYVAQEERV